MNISVISFTQKGFALSAQIQRILATDTVVRYKKGQYLDSSDGIAVTEPLPQWAGKMFFGPTKQDAVIFIGATGIAVRAIAAHIKDKKNDPAVVVLDEQGKFCIPLLAGHIGGANALAAKLSTQLNNCTPVITTATDINEQFAVDLFAVQNDLIISDMKLAKEISARLLHQGQVGFVSELPVCGTLPIGLCRDDKTTDLGICVGIHKNYQPFKKTLWLIPRNIYLGLGCRKETPLQSIADFVAEVCQTQGIFFEAIAMVASIDLKKAEPGILAYCEQQQLPFATYTAAQLQQVPGEFAKSEFVTAVTGVDNVCERSAVAASNNGIIIQNKIAKNGVTISLASADRSVKFE